MSEQDSIRWYAYQMLSGREDYAASQIEDLGFTVANIRELQRKEKKRAITFVPRPLFPGYGLVQFDAKADQWRRINSARNGIRLVVSSALSPIPARPGAIESLLGRVREDGYFHDDDQALYAPWLKLKDKTVRITVGHFANQCGLCTMSENGRIKVLLSAFGGEAEFQMDWNEVEAI